VAQTIFYQSGITVAATVDDKGPRLKFFAECGELDQCGAEILIKQITDWIHAMRLIGICRECNVRTPLHKLECRQAPAQKY